ncbi:MAG TPA: hypothetical protein VGP72_34065 [Planctomycetota bacterium]|jgi:hypothetical protein
MRILSVASFLAGVGILLLASGCGNSGPQGANPPPEKISYLPVPDAALKEGRFVLPNTSCSLEIPGPTWRWMVQQGRGDRFAVQNTASSAMIKVILLGLKKDFDKDAETDIWEGTRIEALSSGIIASNPKYTPSDTPLAGKSWRLTYDAEGQGKKLIGTEYIVSPGTKVVTSASVGHILLCIQGYSADGNDTPMFKKFVESLKVEASNPPSTKADPKAEPKKDVAPEKTEPAKPGEVPTKVP